MSFPGSKSQQYPSTQGFARPNVKLNWELGPWLPAVIDNLLSPFKREPEAPPLNFRPGIFWRDIFVDQRLDWKNLAQSYGYHFIFAGLVYAASMPFYSQRFSVIENFRHDKITYAPEVEVMEAPVETPAREENVPRIVSHSARGPVEMRADALQRHAMAKSVPRDADNRTHTIIDPEAPKLTTEAPMPDLVAWTHTPQAPPVAATAQLQPRLVAPIPEVVPIAPPPEVKVSSAKMPMPAVPDIVPPPVEAKITRDLSNINVSRLQTEVINPEPKLPTQPVMKTMSALSSEVSPVGPPPEIKGVGPASEGSGALISINVAPVQPPETAPRGSARGSFAGAPEGQPTATAEPERHAGGSGPGGESPTVTKEEWGLTAAAPAPTSGARPGAISSMLMSMSLPSMPARPAQPAKELADLSPIDQRVFRGRKSYTMALNTPNLTSVGGSWIFRFAERAATYRPGELIAPVAVREVDPAYPADMIHDKVEGVVILYAVIRADGSVAEVKVLEGFDDRLDENARKALSAWHFVPGTRDGSPVDLEAVVRIPFRARRVF
jgi:protein TonB